MENLLKHTKIVYLYIFSLVIGSLGTIAAEPVLLNLVKVKDIQPLKFEQGYLLINLEINGVAPSIEFYRINSSEQRYLKPSQKLRKRSKKFILDLKKKSEGYYFCNLSPGLYQITKINVPYFEFPFRLDTDNARDWRFSIEADKVNYVGKLEIEKQRSSKNVDVKLLNRIATELDVIDKLIEKIPTKNSLRSGAGVRDDFFEGLVDQNGK